MPKISSQIKDQIKQLSKSDLENILIKIAGKDNTVLDYLVVNYFDKESGEQDLFEKTKTDLDILFSKRYKGFVEELQVANMISACVKRISVFSKICKNKKYEADLILYVLDIPFSLSTKMFGTCFTAYDYKAGLLLKRLITLVTTKLHPDFLIEYKDKINEYLSILHRTSGHIDMIYGLPKSIE